ncbi:YbjN domain-containing protein [Desulfuribacillus alkaliarsenatis]|uniref:YbjN domain-containing protein n=1 Tax=Desulfuribacillus alkaliarsenatis TaxID=766136 RepID=A0A1E5G290_9FIRM|nr:YbjN domain-containing protein [Desulfuribacillus alkaliarsenatis]OEF97108.1 hypothetical protein BHF68_05795 [Desulfuribacillus alkaliarsenatis]
MTTEIKDALFAVIEKNNWNGTEREDIIKIDVDGQNGNWPTFARCLEDSRQFLFYSVLTSKVKEDRLDAIVHLITRINYGLKIGNFELDYDTGELHFKTAVQLSEQAVDQGIIEGQIIINILTMDEYLPIIMKTIYSDDPLEKLLEST